MVHLNTAAAVMVVYVCMLRGLEGFEKDPGCDITKGCFDDCEDPFLCTFLVAWVDDGNNVTYTLTASSEWLTDVWMAVGFSDDQLMGNDSVTGCWFSTGLTGLFNAKNHDHSEPDIISDVGVRLLHISNDGVTLNCTFIRDKKAGEDKFDLEQPWYLLFAMGQLDQGKLQYHHFHPNVSKEKYDPAFKPPVTTTVPTTTTDAITTATTTTSAQSTSQTTTTGEVTTATTTTSAQSTSQTTTTGEVTTATTTTSAQSTSQTTTTGEITTVPTTPAQVTTPQPSGPSVIKVKGCGRLVGCYSDCIGTHCSYIISWYVDGNYAIYTVASAVARKASNWVAIGFSTDVKMGDDDIMGCISDSTGQVIPFTGWNTNYKSPEWYTDSEIKLISQNIEDGSLSCTFRRPLAPASSGNLAASQGSRRVNVSQPWILMFAKGPGSISNGDFQIFNHKRTRFLSTRQISANDAIDVGSMYNEYPLVKTHGIFMIAAWVLISSIGIIIARYYRQFSGSRLFLGYSWLQVHRTYMLLVGASTVIGFVSIYVQSKGYNIHIQDREFLQAHPIIGIIVMVLVALNPCLAVLRPPPGTPKRPLFSWSHRILGVSTQVLAVVNIFFGVQMEKSDVPYYLVYILSAYTVWQLLVTIVLEIVTMFGRKSYRLEVDETSQVASHEEAIAQDSPKTLQAKEVIFWIHCAVLFSFTLSLVVLLGMGNKLLIA